MDKRVHVLCFHVNFKHESTKHACFMYIFYLVTTFYSNYLIMVKGLFCRKQVVKCSLAHRKWSNTVTTILGRGGEGRGEKKSVWPPQHVCF